jgi:hypothetical protein
MKPSLRSMPIVAVIAVSAVSGALASAVVERAAVAATATVQDPALTNLLKYVSVDPAGNVTIKGTQVQISGDATVSVKGATVNVQGSAQTAIKGGIVTLN